jgi:hypothetical protein
VNKRHARPKCANLIRYPIFPFVSGTDRPLPLCNYPSSRLSLRPRPSRLNGSATEPHEIGWRPTTRHHGRRPGPIKSKLVRSLHPALRLGNRSWVQLLVLSFTVKRGKDFRDFRLHGASRSKSGVACLSALISCADGRGWRRGSSLSPARSIFLAGYPRGRATVTGIQTHHVLWIMQLRVLFTFMVSAFSLEGGSGFQAGRVCFFTLCGGVLMLFGVIARFQAESPSNPFTTTMTYGKEGGEIVKEHTHRGHRAHGKERSQAAE